MDLGLGGVVVAGLLGHFDALGVASRQCEYIVADQPVMQDHVGLIECTKATQRKQTGVARARAHQHDGARRHGFRGIEQALRRGFGQRPLSTPQQALHRAVEQALVKAPT